MSHTLRFLPLFCLFPSPPASSSSAGSPSDEAASSFFFFLILRILLASKSVAWGHRMPICSSLEHYLVGRKIEISMDKECSVILKDAVAMLVAILALVNL